MGAVNAFVSEFDALNEIPPLLRENTKLLQSPGISLAGFPAPDSILAF